MSQFKTITATLIWRLPAQGWQGNNLFVCELGLQLDNAGIQINNILTRKEKGTVKITVEVETEMSEEITRDEADKWFYDAIRESRLPDYDTLLLEGNEFAEELEEA